MLIELHIGFITNLIDKILENPKKAVLFLSCDEILVDYIDYPTWDLTANGIVLKFQKINIETVNIKKISLKFDDKWIVPFEIEKKVIGHKDTLVIICEIRRNIDV